MFGENYKKAHKEISPSQEILEKIEREIKNAKAPKPRIMPIKKVVALAASLAIILAALSFLPHIPPLKTDTPPGEEIVSSKPNSNDDEELPSKSYQKIFNRINGYADSFSDYDMYSTLGSADEEALPETNATTDQALGDVIIQNKGETALSSKGEAEAHDKADFSKTNKQVEDVDEADIVKTDGEYIYRISVDYDNSREESKTESSYIKTDLLYSNQTFLLKIYKASGKNTALVSETEIKSSSKELQNINVQEMFLLEDKLFVIFTSGTELKTNRYCPLTGLLTYDISNPEKPKRIDCKTQSGYYSSSRLSAGVVFLITNHWLDYGYYNVYEPETYVPFCYTTDGEAKPFPANDVCVYRDMDSMTYTVVCSYSTKDSDLIDRVATFGGSGHVYMNKDYLVTAGYQSYNDEATTNKTRLFLFELNEKGKIELKTTAEIKGELLNQFSMDIYKDNLRFVTTVQNFKNGSQTNSLYILDTDLKLVGSIEGLAKEERIYSARFTGDIGYFVTFRETDPLFAADLSNPKKPKILSALKIPGFSSYLHPYSSTKLLGLGYNVVNGATTSIKLSMFDTSDPTNVTEMAKLNVTKGYAYSEAIDNHKAFFVDTEKNIFGFSFWDYSSSEEYKFVIYSFKNGKFELIKEIALSSQESDSFLTRGLYIGDYFYISTSERLYVYNMNTWKTAAVIE